jgi:hypothetical protein
MTQIISRGSSHGGLAAIKDALLLWAQCAEGSADFANLPGQRPGAYVRLHAARAGFEAAIEAVTEYWGSDNCAPETNPAWRTEARSTLTKAAGHLLAACQQVEHGNRANAWFEVEGENISFHWEGTSTQGRWVDAIIHLGDDPEVVLCWDTATGGESTYLHLPSMTNEADASADTRREGGWDYRATLD